MKTPLFKSNQDQLKFSEEVRKFQGLVYAMAFSLMLNADDSLDLLQEAFLKAYDEPRFLLPDFNRKNWLVKVVRNLALNMRKSWWRKVKLLAGYDSAETHTTDCNYAEFLIHQENLIRLKEAMRELNDDERDLLALRYVAGHKNATIAEMLGIKVGTVMSRLARLKEKLGNRLKDEEDDYE